MNKIKLIIIVLISGYTLISFSQDSNLEQKVDFNEVNYSFKEILEKINEIQGISIIYDEKNLPVHLSIQLNKKSYSIKEILEIIIEKFPVEYTVDGKYIIIKKRKLSSKYKIYGIVMDADNREKMIGVNIYIEENMMGIVSNADGSFSLFLKPGEYTLNCSYMGYDNKEIFLNVYNDKELIIEMKQGTKYIDEVKITSQRSFFGDMETGRTIETINSKDIKMLNTNNASDILHARLKGVWATKISGAPGDHQKVRIRGINSLFGSVDPLYIVDGVPVPVVNLSTLGIADININDIENVTILKDVSSTALYGYQGGNGVVIIDTKSGGDKNISFSAKSGIQQLYKKYELMNSYQFINSLDSARRKLRVNLNDYYPEYNSTICSNDWQDNIFQTGMLHEYQLSASGNKYDFNYYISGNYLNHEGIIKNSSYKRYSLSANINRKFKEKLLTGMLFKSAVQNNRNNLDNYGGNLVIFEGINKSPCFRCTPDRYYHIDQDLTFPLANRLYYEYDELNYKEDPDSLINHINKTLDIYTNTFNIYAKYNILPGIILNASSSLSFRKYKYLTDYRRYTYGIYDEFIRLEDNFYESTENYIITNQQFNITWHKLIKYHGIKLIAGYRNYKDNVYWELDTITNEIESLSKSEEIYTRGSLVIYGEKGTVIRSINSYIGHLSYNYKNKYFISFIANYDNLKEGINVDVHDFFPSLAVNWDIAREKVFNHTPWLNHLNFYVNWGQTGNYPLNSISNDLYTNGSYVFGDTVLHGTAVAQLANHFLRHEKSEEYNTGFEISLLNNRLILSGDLYSKTNSYLIIQRDIPYYYGGGRIFLNVGITRNVGNEFSIEAYPVTTSKILVYSKFNFSKNSQHIKKLDKEDELVFKDNDILVPDFIIRTNEPIGSITGYKYLGKWTDEDDLINDITVVRSNNLKFLNSDTSNLQLTSSDKTVIGNSIPDCTWNWYNTVNYKNFSIDFLWYGVIGVNKYNATRAASYIAATNNEINTIINDTIKALNNRAFYESSYFVENADFIRLKQLSFTYTIPRNDTRKVGYRFSLSIENLLTFSKYKGYDPEATVYTDNNFSDNAIDRGAYPIPRSVYLSIELNL